MPRDALERTSLGTPVKEASPPAEAPHMNFLYSGKGASGFDLSFAMSTSIGYIAMRGPPYVICRRIPALNPAYCERVWWGLGWSVGRRRMR